MQERTHIEAVGEVVIIGVPHFTAVEADICDRIDAIRNKILANAGKLIGGWGEGEAVAPVHISDPLLRFLVAAVKGIVD